MDRVVRTIAVEMDTRISITLNASGPTLSITNLDWVDGDGVEHTTRYDITFRRDMAHLVAQYLGVM